MLICLTAGDEDKIAFTVPIHISVEIQTEAAVKHDPGVTVGTPGPVR